MNDQTVVLIRHKRRTVRLAAAFAMALVSVGGAFSARAEDVNETLEALKKQIELMQRQIERLEREQRQHQRQRTEANKKIDALKAEQTRQAQADKKIAEQRERQEQVRAELEKQANVEVFARGNNKFQARCGVPGRCQSQNAFNGGVIKDEDEIDTTDSLGGFIAYQHFWT